MKKVRAYIVVDLEVSEDFNAKRDLAVVYYEDLGLNESFIPKTDNFEVVEYVDIRTEEG